MEIISFLYNKKNQPHFMPINLNYLREIKKFVFLHSNWKRSQIKKKPFSYLRTAAEMMGHWILGSSIPK